MRKILRQKFFDRPAPIVAQDLLGKFLVRRFRGKEVSAQITEVEAYDGFRDKASHAVRGKTPRNEVMFGPAGFFYIYLVYGTYWMLNIVTYKKEYPSAVLIRGVEDIYGPGKVTKHFKITKSLNCKPALQSSRLWIEDRRFKISSRKIQKTCRIGVEYAGPYWSSRKWRFVVS